MKSYTDLEQSKKLAEILPLESADIRYHTVSHYNPYSCDEIIYTVDFDRASGKDIPCWSLAALLDVFPMVVGRDLDMYCCWQNSKNLHSRHYDNPVDACYEMIVKLHEQNIL